MAKSRPADVFFLTCPRTLSNLLVKLLSEQTGWEHLGYFLHGAFQYGLGNLTECDVKPAEEKIQEYLTKLRAGYQKMLAARENAHENGHAVFLKSHIEQIFNPSALFNGIYSGMNASAFTVEPEASSSASTGTNPTMLSDEMLLSFVPVLLIRHPALVVDSYYRAKGFSNVADLCQSYVTYSTSMHFTRALFEWYAATAASKSASAAVDIQLARKWYPILIDADDILEGDTVQRLAKAIGMDPDQILEQWEARSTDGLEPKKRRFVQGMWGSTRIDKSKSSKGLDLEAKFKSWNELYGMEVGKVLADLTNSHMRDYLWLKSHKF